MAIEGDSTFTRMNMKKDRGSLDPGEYAYAENKRTRTGVAQDRLGCLPPHFANFVDYGTILCAQRYINPETNADVILVATPSMVYMLRDGTAPVEIALPVGVTLAEPCEFVQGYSKVILWRGPDLPELEWDGNLLNHFTAIKPPFGLDPSFKKIPQAETAEYFEDRWLVPHGNGFAMSDIGETFYDSILSQIPVVTGPGGPITRLLPFGNGLLAFKRRAIAAVYNFTIDPSQANREVITSTLGTSARKSGAQVGSDVLFLSEPTGVFRLSQVIDSRIQAAPVPISDPIKPLIDRINWPFAQGAVGCAFGEYYYLAVPIDGSHTNNAILIYNTTTDGWEGFDTFAGDMVISDLLVYLYLGQPYLYSIDKEAGAIYVLGVGKSDQLVGGEVWIESRFETRGYAQLPATKSEGAILAHKNFRIANIGLATWNPRYEIAAISDGVNEVHPLTSAPTTRNRTKYNSFGRGKFEPTNTNGDFAVDQREDYSIDGDTGIYLDSGDVEPERKQETRESFGFRAHGRWVSYRITNTQGSCDIIAVGTEAQPAQRNFRRAA